MPYIPTPAMLLLFAAVLPLAGFVVLLFIGHWLAPPMAGWIGTILVGASFVCSLWAMVLWFQAQPGHYLGSEWGKGYGPINIPVRWIPVGLPGLPNGVGQDHPRYLDLGVYVDSLSIAMFAMITLVATVVHVFSIGYMADDPEFSRYFAFLGLFCFSMLGLVIGGTLVHLLIFWELVGLCSYLLIGFWHEKKGPSNAAIKAFVTNRVGDTGFLIGLGILFYFMGNASFVDLWTYLGGAGSGRSVMLPGGVEFGAPLLTAMGIGLFFGAVGKSAQFPLHVWLPDAMEGPTPVSALIHAATMVAAGVYLVGRIFPILTPNAKLFIAIIGVITLTMAALVAVAQSDIKRVLAFSTISQLGYMMLAMGVGSWVGGMFHLITHAFYKALLFLAAGSVIHAAHHEQEMSAFGGLLRKIPLTAVTFGIAVLTIAGTPYFSAAYSKTMILEHAAAFVSLARLEGRASAYGALFALPAAVSVLTAFYMARCWMLTFWGKPRSAEVHAGAREFPIMVVPLCALTLMSIFSGKYFVVQQLLESSIRETQAACRDAQSRDDFFRGREEFTGFKRIWPTDASETPGQDFEPAADRGADALEAGRRMENHWVGWAWLMGIGLGVILYANGYSLPRLLLRVPPFRWIQIWLYHRMFFDELYFAIVVRGVWAVAWVAAGFDRTAIDGVVNFCGWATRGVSRLAGWADRQVIDAAVNGVGTIALEMGAAVRVPQTGRVRTYVTVLLLALAMAVAGAVLVVLSH